MDETPVLNRNLKHCPFQIPVPRCDHDRQVMRKFLAKVEGEPIATTPMSLPEMAALSLRAFKPLPKPTTPSTYGTYPSTLTSWTLLDRENPIRQHQEYLLKMLGSVSHDLRECEGKLEEDGAGASETLRKRKRKTKGKKDKLKNKGNSGF